GGGGFGPAIERPAEKVAADVQQGYVSQELAEQAYGVIVDNETKELDQAATEKRRKEMS
ncbi:MAG: hydantoinase B/oxoprolinase family protein, partial [Rhodospirillaceae bacterium]|nr:hydantoinase B/oxoprolinase family protein [Rhodospirillaceae bacterium]